MLYPLPSCCHGLTPSYESFHESFHELVILVSVAISHVQPVLVVLLSKSDFVAELAAALYHSPYIHEAEELHQGEELLVVEEAGSKGEEGAPSFQRAQNLEEDSID